MKKKEEMWGLGPKQAAWHQISVFIQKKKKSTKQEKKKKKTKKKKVRGQWTRTWRSVEREQKRTDREGRMHKITEPNWSGGEKWWRIGSGKEMEEGTRGGAMEGGEVFPGDGRRGKESHRPQNATAIITCGKKPEGGKGILGSITCPGKI